MPGTGTHAKALGAIALAVLLSSSGARAQVWHGNDTGGIIPWSCENEAVAHQAAAAYCAQWRKYPRITAVIRRYGDYISFNCLWRPDIGRANLPAVPTRSYCPGESQRLFTK